jgi:hypothetical protein
MHKNDGILYAIQSLAGVYIYDYLPDERIRQFVNQRYYMAAEYFGKLLNAPDSRVIGEGKEVITMAVLLSMQDVCTVHCFRFYTRMFHCFGVIQSDWFADRPD